jgi:hypothetical protein
MARSYWRDRAREVRGLTHQVSSAKAKDVLLQIAVPHLFFHWPEPCEVVK